MKKTVYFLIDCSGSMYGDRADAVNQAMQSVVDEAIPEIASQKTSDLDLYFKVIGFSDYDPQNRVFEIMPEISLDAFDSWTPIDADLFNGGTPTGAAIQYVIDDLKGVNRGEPSIIRPAAPAIILISDGLPNGQDPSYDDVLQCAEKTSPRHEMLFRKALRVAIGINVDEDGRNSLKKFGRVSVKMAKNGIESYYDCSEDYVDKLVEIVKSVTINATLD